MNKKLQITLWVVTAYLTILGALFLFAPRIAEMVISAKLPDAGLNMLYGQMMLTFAYVGYMAATSGESRLLRALLALTTGHVVIFGSMLATGMQPFVSVGAPLIVNLVFTILLFLWRK